MYDDGALQLHQLDSEVLQHAQAKAERFGSKGNKPPRSAHRSEGDPFADAGPSGQYNDLPSDDDEDAGKPTKFSVVLWFRELERSPACNAAVVL